MDTRFWGKPGHKLLHSIAYCYSFNTSKETIEENNLDKKINIMFNSLKYILPCIYCRRSYSKYIKDIPIKKFNNEKNNYNIFKWLYLIHNKINDKLKKQGYFNENNPSYSSIEDKYERYVKNINCMVGWDFLYSIVFDYPQYSFEMKNTKYNAYITFFTILKEFLPCKKIRQLYKNYIENNPIENHMETRDDLKKWLYKLEKKINKKCCNYTKRCKKIEKYVVSKCNDKTCRKSL